MSKDMLWQVFRVLRSKSTLRYTRDIMVKKASKQTATKKITSTKVSYEPNKVGLAVATVAVVSLVLIALIVTS